MCRWFECSPCRTCLIGCHQASSLSYLNWLKDRSFDLALDRYWVLGSATDLAVCGISASFEPDSSHQQAPVSWSLLFLASLFFLPLAGTLRVSASPPSMLPPLPCGISRLSTFRIQWFFSRDGLPFQHWLVLSEWVLLHASSWSVGGGCRTCFVLGRVLRIQVPLSKLLLIAAWVNQLALCGQQGSFLAQIEILQGTELAMFEWFCAPLLRFQEPSALQVSQVPVYVSP